MFHVRRIFDDFLIVEGEFVWRSSTYLSEKLVERSGKDYRLLFFFFTPLYNSRRESGCTLWPLGGCESSRLFKGLILSSLHCTEANFPAGRRNRWMNRVDCNYDAESMSWILSTKLLAIDMSLSLPKDYKRRRLLSSHDLLDVRYRNNNTERWVTS